MGWYSAHIVMFAEFKDGPQETYPVWENIVLVEAGTEAEAFEKAERHGRSEEGDDGGTFRWGKHPARWVFAGVRKLTECQTSPDRPGDGTEVSFNELELESREAVKRLAAGEPVTAAYHDRYRPPEKRKTPADRAGSAKNRRV